MPSPTIIRTSRLALNLTQAQAGAIVGATARAWRAWESGFRVMPSSKWELWEIKTKEMKKSVVGKWEPSADSKPLHTPHEVRCVRMEFVSKEDD